MIPDVAPAGEVDLRRIAEDHVDALVAAITSSLEELRPWFPWATEPPDPVQQVGRVRELTVAFDAGTDFEFGIFEGATQELVGALRLNPHEGPGTGAIGYWVRSDRQRRGYASAAVRAATSAAFDHLPAVEQIEIHMDRANVASTGVARSAGYTLDREVTRDVLTPGHTGRGWVWVAERGRWRRRHQ